MIRHFAWIVLVSQLLNSAVWAQENSISASHQQVADALTFIRHHSDPKFWQLGLERYTPKRAQITEVTGRVTTATGGAMLAYGATAETAMKFYGVKDPLLAMTQLYSDLNFKLPERALHYIAPRSQLYQRVLARAETSRKLIDLGIQRAIAERDLKSLRWQIRGIGIVGGALLGAGLTLVTMSDETAGPADSEMGKDYFEKPVSLAIALAEPQITDEQILSYAEKYDGLKANLLAMASLLEDVQSVSLAVD